MKRDTTVLAICGLVFMATFLCLDRALAELRWVGTSNSVGLLTASAAVAFACLAVAVTLLRKKYIRQKKPGMRAKAAYEAGQHLRRSVFSLR